MSIEKLEEFAKDGDKNLDNLDVSQGFLQSEKPERQWFNQLLNNLTRKTNEVIDYTDGVADDVTAQKLDTGITATAKGEGIARTQAEKNSDIISAQDYGAIGDGTLHKLSERFDTLGAAQIAYGSISSRIVSLDQSIDWAAIQAATKNNPHVSLGTHDYVITDTITVPDGHVLAGNGAGWDYTHNTTIYLYGIGDKEHTCPDITDALYQFVNPDVGAAYLADSGSRGNVYKLNDYSDGFSVGIKLGKDSKIRDFGILCWWGDKNSKYFAPDATSPDAWDVGVWAANADTADINRVTAWSTFKKAGLFISASTLGDSKIPSAESLSISYSRFAGHMGLSIRSNDTASGSNYGFGGTSFVQCQFRSYEHPLNCLSTSSMLNEPQDRPSGCIEISGATMRGIDFVTCTALSRQDVSMYFGECSEIFFNSCYQEAKNIKINGEWADDLVGARLIASDEGKAKFNFNSKFGIDTSPVMTREVSAKRYTVSSAGLASKLSAIMDDDYTDMVYQSNYGKRLRYASDAYVIRAYDTTIKHEFKSDGRLNTGNVVTESYVTAGTSITAGQDLKFGSSLVSNTAGAAIVLKRTDATGSPVTSLYVSGVTGEWSVYGTLKPEKDSTYNLGSSSNRWATMYAATGVINTSDERLKTKFDAINTAEKRAALRIKAAIGRYQFIDSVDEKGDKARYHFGVGAQTVGQIMRDEGLNPDHYAFYCYDEWEATEEIEAGNRYGIRYEELSMFIMAAT